MHMRELFCEIGLEMYGADAKAAVRDVFGKIRVGNHFEHSGVHFDELGEHGPKNTIYRVNLRADALPLTLAHEFGHVMHCHHWPERSGTVSEEIAERAALWAEGAYVHKYLGGPMFMEWLCVSHERYEPGAHRSAIRWLYRTGFKEYVVESLPLINGLMGVFHAEAG